MAELTVTLTSHHFKISKISVRGRGAVEQFARKYIQYALERHQGRFMRVPHKVFAAATADRTEYRFHINLLPEFQDYLRLAYLEAHMIDYVNAPLPEPKVVSLILRDDVHTPRPAQELAVDYILADKPVHKLVSMQTGQGKSFVAMIASARLSWMPVYMVKPGYIEKWILDLRRTYQLELKDLMVIRGTESLQALLELAVVDAIPSKIILISNRTMQIWIKLYEKLGDGTLEIGYACRPDEFFALLKAGIRIIDEVHQDFHLNFKIDLYTNVKKALSMSATLSADDAFLNRMYEIAYPMKDRFEGDAYIKYISATALLYRFEKPELIKSENWRQKTYSHHTFEESVMKHKEVLKNYIDMFKTVVDAELVYDHVDGEKMLIYVASVVFATELVRRLQIAYPQFKVRRYCGTENDPYDDLMTADLSVSTLGSAGTNVDIAGLKCVFLSNAVNATQSNIQGFGRLRNNLAPGRVPRFVWATNEDTKKQIEYHDRKMVILKPKALTLNSQVYYRTL
jgi:hypothetical protein